MTKDVDKRIYTPEEIDKLLFKYRNTGNNKYMAEILKAFDGFIYKYVRFLRFGHYKYTDKDIIHLISMLSASIPEKTVRYINNLFADMEFEDVLSEIRLMFMKSVKKFVKKKNGPYFAGYLYNYFKYDVKAHIKYLSKDAMYHVNKSVKDTMKHETQETTAYQNICFSSTNCLTQLEKYILYLCYGKKMNGEQVGNMLGMARSSITVIKNKAKYKLIQAGMMFDDFEIL